VQQNTKLVGLFAYLSQTPACLISRRDGLVITPETGLRSLRPLEGLGLLQENTKNLQNSYFMFHLHKYKQKVRLMRHV